MHYSLQYFSIFGPHCKIYSSEIDIISLPILNFKIYYLIRLTHVEDYLEWSIESLISEYSFSTNTSWYYFELFLGDSKNGFCGHGVVSYFGVTDF